MNALTDFLSRATSFHGIGTSLGLMSKHSVTNVATTEPNRYAPFLDLLKILVLLGNIYTHRHYDIVLELGSLDY